MNSDLEFDAAVVSTLPTHLSRWLKLDLRHRRANGAARRARRGCGGVAGSDIGWPRRGDAGGSPIRAGRGPSGLCLHGPGGFIVDWNLQAAATFGWTREEAVGRVLADTIVPRRFREAHLAGLQRFLETREGPVLDEPIELVGLHREGHEFPIEITITALDDGAARRFTPSCTTSPSASGASAAGARPRPPSCWPRRRRWTRQSRGCSRPSAPRSAGRPRGTAVTAGLSPISSVATPALSVPLDTGSLRACSAARTSRTPSWRRRRRAGEPDRALPHDHQRARGAAGAHGAPGPDRRADRPPQPARGGTRACCASWRGRAATATTSAWPCSTWTTSRRSTTSAATRRATRSCAMREEWSDGCAPTCCPLRRRGVRAGGGGPGRSSGPDGDQPPRGPPGATRSAGRGGHEGGRGGHDGRPRGQTPLSRQSAAACDQTVVGRTPAPAGRPRPPRSPVTSNSSKWLAPRRSRLSGKVSEKYSWTIRYLRRTLRATARTLPFTASGEVPSLARPPPGPPFPAAREGSEPPGDFHVDQAPAASQGWRARRARGRETRPGGHSRPSSCVRAARSRNTRPMSPTRTRGCAATSAAVGLHLRRGHRDRCG